MTEKRNYQIIKTRDDHSIVQLSRDESSVESPFVLPEDAKCSWAESGKHVDILKLRSRIEPWLTALFQSEHLSLLVGSGLTHAVHGIARSEELPGMQTLQFGIFDNEISVAAKKLAKATGRKDGNLEDLIRVANDLLRGLEIFPPSDILDGRSGSEQVAALREGLNNAISSFTTSILDGEYRLSTASPEKREQAVNYLVSFLMSFASRSGTRERLHIFTTNYDRYLEAGADVAGLRMIDRFVGTLAPVFRSSRLNIDLHYNPP